MASKSLIKGFKRPRNIIFEHDELQPNYGSFSAEPFEKGYGLTIGNSLRRVLLSSISGSAITAIKVDGVAHEFVSIEGFYEDVSRIILNLKKLKFQYEGDIPRVLHIVKEGAAELTGKDFNVDPDVKVMNPDQHIATLNEKGKIDMEVQVENGRGYVPAELSKGSSEVVGVIGIDADFTPVKKVNIRVENTRVGQRTDYDRLILEVWTDGSVSPDDALAQAAKIIKDHLTIFINFEEEIEEEAEVVDENAEKMRKTLSRSIDDLELSIRSYNTIKSLDITILEHLVRKTEDEFRKSKHYSEQVLKEMKAKLETLHLSLGLKE